MEVAAAIILVLTILCAILAYEFFGLPRRRHRVIVNFRDQTAPAIEGILWQRRGRWVVLRDCFLIETAKQSPTRVDGEITIDRERVQFFQVPHVDRR